MTDLVLDSELGAEQLEHLQIVKASADSLLTIINDVLDFSKIEAGKLLIESIPFDVAKAVSETLKTLALRAHQKGLELLSDLPADLPRSLSGDPGRQCDQVHRAGRSRSRAERDRAHCERRRAGIQRA
jgi:signal transduction histidine kinase